MADLVLNDTEKINYYYKPINSFIGLEDSSRKTMITVFTDRVTGGTSRKPGSIEIMVDRKATGTDKKGVIESMNDNYSIDVTHTIFICFTEKKNNSGMKRCRSRRRAIQIEREAEPILVKSALSGFLLKDPKSESAYFPVEHVDKNALLSRYGMQNVRIDFFTESVTDKDLGLIKYVLRLYNYSEKALKDKEITIRSVLGALGVERHRVVVVKN